MQSVFWKEDLTLAVNGGPPATTPKLLKKPALWAVRSSAS
jgi:hypothetical protein